MTSLFSLCRLSGLFLLSVLLISTAYGAEEEKMGTVIGIDPVSYTHLTLPTILLV